jgi:hypothetical protein
MGGSGVDRATRYDPEAMRAAIYGGPDSIELGDALVAGWT